MSSLMEHYSNPANRVCQCLYFTGQAARAEKGHINYSKFGLEYTREGYTQESTPSPRHPYVFLP